MDKILESWLPKGYQERERERESTVAVKGYDWSEHCSSVVPESKRPPYSPTGALGYKTSQAIFERLAMSKRAVTNR